MQKIPEDILARFERVLIERRIPALVRSKYRTWLRYFLDFRNKYTPPADRSEQIRLFVDKLRSKNQTGEHLEQAADAVSIFFALEREDQKRALPAEERTQAAGTDTVPPVSLPAGSSFRPITVSVPRRSSSMRSPLDL